MSVKVKQAITKCLIKIEDDTFDEDTIRTLLMVSRENITEGLIKELAHFIAHTERSKGMFHKKVNSRYAKYKLTSDQVQKTDVNELMQKIKTEDELSDFMLGGVSVEKIEAKLFDILYSDGLDDLPESHLIQYTGFKRTEVKEFLKRSYEKKNGFYYLTTVLTENLIGALRSLPLSKYNPAQHLEMAANMRTAENAAKKIKSTMDRIQKVVRGAIFFNSVFETDTFKSEMVTTFSQVIQKFSIDKKYIKHLKDKSDDILLCIMTLLHDCKFTFYDKNEARTFLCFYLTYNAEEAKQPEYDVSKALYNKGVIALYLSGEHTITFPLFVSDLPIRNYLPYDVYMKNPLDSDISEAIWTTASRVNKQLQLTDAT